MASDNITLMFVYNADSGLINKLKDAVHKSFSPSTYQCSLCDVTYSPIMMRSKWRSFVKSLPYNVEFTYKDIVEKQYDMPDHDFPNAWIRSDGQLQAWLTAKEIGACETLDELIELVRNRLPNKG